MSSVSEYYSFSSIFTTVEKITILWIALSTFRTTGPSKVNHNDLSYFIYHFLNKLKYVLY